MDATNAEAAERHFIEDAGIVLEQSGLPRMAGRILGWLLISDPPQQSTSELCRKVGASKGSVSTMTRLLLRTGAIELVGVAGARANFFRVNREAFSHLLADGAKRYSALRGLSEQGMKLLEGHNPRMLERLEEMHDFYSYLEQEIPATIRRWQDVERFSRRRSRADALASAKMHQMIENAEGR